MIDHHVEELIEPIQAALRELSEDQLGDLADGLSRLQLAVDDELARRESGEDRPEEDEELDDADVW